MRKVSIGSMSYFCFCTRKGVEHHLDFPFHAPNLLFRPSLRASFWKIYSASSFFHPGNLEGVFNAMHRHKTTQKCEFADELGSNEASKPHEAPRLSVASPTNLLRSGIPDNALSGTALIGVETCLTPFVRQRLICRN